MLREALDAPTEMLRILRKMKAENVCAEQPFEDFLAPRQDAEGVRRRPRDVAEPTDSCPVAFVDKIGSE
jgi:hypothetical protein